MPAQSHLIPSEFRRLLPTVSINAPDCTTPQSKVYPINPSGSVTILATEAEHIDGTERTIFYHLSTTIPKNHNWPSTFCSENSTITLSNTYAGEVLYQIPARLQQHSYTFKYHGCNILLEIDNKSVAKFSLSSRWSILVTAYRNKKGWTTGDLSKSWCSLSQKRTFHMIRGNGMDADAELRELEAALTAKLPSGSDFAMIDDIPKYLKDYVYPAICSVHELNEGTKNMETPQSQSGLSIIRTPMGHLVVTVRVNDERVDRCFPSGGDLSHFQIRLSPEKEC